MHALWNIAWLKIKVQLLEIAYGKREKPEKEKTHFSLLFISFSYAIFVSCHRAALTVSRLHDWYPLERNQMAKFILYSWFPGENETRDTAPTNFKSLDK